jgi:XRE family aerobic/anaerobic benzoate catabolism transcriptional regulator
VVRHPRTPNPAYRRAFAEQLRAARHRAGLSQEDLANSAEMSQRYLSGLESGAGNPTLEVIAALAAALRVDPASLIPPLPARRGRA